MNYIFRYLRSTTKFGILLPNNDSEKLIVYNDQEWGQNESARCSRMGAILLNANKPTVCSSTVQNVTATSIVEDENVALNATSKSRRDVDEQGEGFDRT